MTVRDLRLNADASRVRDSRQGFWLSLLMLLAVTTANAETITGRVVGVSDGDTITVLDAKNHEFKIRLSGIDAPEKKQPYGSRAKESLSDMVFNKEVVVESNKMDRYRRKVGKVHQSGKDVSLEQLRKGMAWHYTAYAKEQPFEDRIAYENAQNEAQAERRGLWREPTQQPPWEFRRGTDVSPTALSED